MKFEKISLMHVFFAIIGLFAVASIAFFMIVCKPKLDEISSIKGQIEGEKTKLEQARMTIRQLDSLKLRQATMMSMLTSMVDKELEAGKAVPLTILQSSEFFQVLLAYLEKYPGVEVGALTYAKNGITFSLGSGAAQGAAGGAPAAPAAAPGGGGEYDWAPTPLPLTIAVKDYDTLRGYIGHLNKFPLLLAVGKMTIAASAGAQSGSQPAQGAGPRYAIGVALPLTMFQIRKGGAAPAAPAEGTTGDMGAPPPPA